MKISDEAVAPAGVREIRCALPLPHQPHGETVPDEPERSWWCPGDDPDKEEEL